MISASSRRARSRPSAVLPHPVGPVSTRAFSNGAGSMPPLYARAYNERRMPEFTITHEIARPPADVFAFLRTPANLPALIPPDVALELIEAVETLQPGDRLTWKARRWGITQRIVMAVTELEETRRLVLTQEHGPFARWEQVQTFEATATGTRLTEAVTFEPPRGMLGRLLT